MGKMIMQEQAAPDTPATDRIVIYPKSGGGLYKKNDAGVEVEIGFSGTELSDDLTPELGGDLDLNTHNFFLPGTLTDDHDYEGTIIQKAVGESVVFGELLYFDWTDKEYKKADADASSTMPGLVIALESKVDGENCKLLIAGWIRDDSAFDFAGTLVYASCTPGEITTTAPNASGDQVQIVGYAYSADILFFNPHYLMNEVA